MGFMDRSSGAHPEQIKAAVQKAQDAWDGGSLAYVQKSKTMASLDGDAATAMVDGILRIGRSLHSTALAYNQTGANTEEAMFTFVRPADA